MFNPPTVEEARAARQRHAAKFNNHLDAISADCAHSQYLRPCRPLLSTSLSSAYRRAAS